MKPRVLITGINGMIANRLSELLTKQGYDVIGLTHSKSKQDKSKGIYYWDIDNKYIDKEAFDGLSYIVHLSGHNVNNRWNKKNKNLMLKSRIDSSKLLFENVKKRDIKLKAFISSSAIGYYGYDDDYNKSFSENDKPSKSNFLSKICIDWEKQADRFKKLGIRTVKIRTSIVLSKKSKALEQIKNTINKNIGIYFSKVYFPWIHIDDLCNVFIEAIEDNKMEGAYNATSTQVDTTMKEFVSQLGKAMNKNKLLMIRIPHFLVKIIFGEKATMILQKNKIIPKRLRDKNFKYKYNHLRLALKDIL